MTVPEENRAKTETTDEVVEQDPERGDREEPSGTMAEALNEAGIAPEQFDE